MERTAREHFRGIGVVPVSEFSPSADECTAVFSFLEMNQDGKTVLLVDKHVCPGSFTPHERAWNAAARATRAWMDSWLDARRCGPTRSLGVKEASQACHCRCSLAAGAVRRHAHRRRRVGWLDSRRRGMAVWHLASDVPSQSTSAVSI